MLFNAHPSLTASLLLVSLFSPAAYSRPLTFTKAVEGSTGTNSHQNPPTNAAQAAELRHTIVAQFQVQSPEGVPLMESEREGSRKGNSKTESGSGTKKPAPKRQPKRRRPHP